MSNAQHCTNHSPLQVFLHYGDPDRGNAVETHGLAERGLPELEIARVSPAYLLPSAAALLEDIGEYMLDRGEPIASGETVMVGPSTMVRLERAVPRAGERSRLRVIDVAPEACPMCEGVDHDLWSDAWPRARCCTSGDELQADPSSSEAAVADELPN